MEFRLNPEQAAFQHEVTSFIESGLPSGWQEEHDSINERMGVERDIMKRFPSVAGSRCHGRRNTADWAPPRWSSSYSTSTWLTTACPA